MRELSSILPSVEKYYSEKVAAFGSAPRGADWKSAESQTMRFDQLLRLIQSDKPFTINDYGCGYGALVDYLDRHNHQFDYRGFDISEKMISEALRTYGHRADCAFFFEKSRLAPADFTIASGIFNVKLETPESEWLEYMHATLNEFTRLSRKGFAFNALTSYSDAEFMQPHLYYANPLHLFDYCKKNFSRMVSLVHDYPLYEFTIFVRMGAD
jgi:hypothetical protein